MQGRLRPETKNLASLDTVNLEYFGEGFIFMKLRIHEVS